MECPKFQESLKIQVRTYKIKLVTKVAPKVKPSKSIKKYQRKKITTKQIPNTLLKNTFWHLWVDEVKIPDYLNGDLIDQNFSLEIKETIELKKKDSYQDLPTIKKEISIFDPKRTQNISIILSRFQYSGNEIQRILREFECDTLEQGELEMLNNMLPNAEEESKLYEYLGEHNDLAKPDRFVIKVFLN